MACNLMKLVSNESYDDLLYDGNKTLHNITEW